MAVVQPAPAAVQTTLPPPAKTGRSCFGCGCGGCLISIVLVVLLVVGGGYYFLVAQASAAINSPAALIVVTTPVDVDTNNSAGFHPGLPGQELTAGNIVRTGDGGHAAIQFPDGSFVRMAPATTVTLTSAQLAKDGTLQSASLVQKVGRTFTNVQHLVSGASFQVGGHSVSAAVRGTQFEVLVRPDNTNLIKVFDGTVKVSGKLSGQGPIKPEAQDPYALEAQCARAVSTGTNAGTVQTSTGDSLATGQTETVEYNSPGGVLSIALCYPGSLMSVTLIDPSGASHGTRQGAPPVQFNVNGPPGRYRAVIRAISAPGGEPYAVAFASNAGCSGEKVDTGTFVRETLSNDQISKGLQQAGVTLQVQGTSNNSARLYYYSDLGGVPISWTLVFYAASPNLGVVNITTQLASRLPAGISQSLSVPTDYTVDRVYSCKGPAGGVMVIEGHR